MKLLLKNVRLAFPSIFEAKTVNGEGEPRFSASFLLAPDHPQLRELHTALKSVAKEKWNEKADAEYGKMEKQSKLCLHDGDDKENYEGFAGNFYITAANKTRPLVIDRNRSPLTQADGRPYAGSYVNASIDIWAQDNKFGKRINASLTGVQFVRDGDAFTGGGVASAEEFEDLEEGAEADLI